MSQPVEKMLFAQAILENTIATLRFYPCPCGNLQPFKGQVPDCEECGRQLPPCSAGDDC